MTSAPRMMNAMTAKNPRRIPYSFNAAAMSVSCFTRAASMS